MKRPLLPMGNGYCSECGQDAYPGMHDDKCSRYNPADTGIPVALRNQVLPPPTEPCEWCRLHTPPSEYCSRIGHKPVGQPCDVCGNAAPRGTYRGNPAPYTGPAGGDLDRPCMVQHHTPPRAPQWHRAVA